MFSRGNNNKTIPLPIVGSSSFGTYPKISIETTYNMFQSSSDEDAFMISYPGYKIGISSSQLSNADAGRGVFASAKLDRIVAVFDKNVYLIQIDYDQILNKVSSYQVVQIGELKTSRGIVYISENNKPQIIISDGQYLYIYDKSFNGASFSFTADSVSNYLSFVSPTTVNIGDSITVEAGVGATLPSGLSTGITYYVSASSPTPFTTSSFQLALTYEDAINATNPVALVTAGTPPNNIVTRGTFSTVLIDFTPGNVIFHDTYFVVAATNDTSQGSTLNNTWRISVQNDGTHFPSDAQHVGLLETKPDKTSAIARIPSGGNLIFVMGNNVVEPWFNEGAQLFPYQRNDQYNSDYGCISAATVCSLDNIVVWLGKNEKASPVILVSTGTLAEKLITDGIDRVFSHLQFPEDSQAFLFRKDGHMIYHINFYSDNKSFFYDFNTSKFYNACDENKNYYMMSGVVFYRNQYYSITPNNGEFYVWDSTIYQYQTVDNNKNVITTEIPRSRTCNEIRLPGQDYFVINDVGFTIETGETDYIQQDHGPLFLTTMVDEKLVTIGSTIFLITLDGKQLITLTGINLIATQDDSPEFDYLIATQEDIVNVTPRVDLSISYDGGASFGNRIGYDLFPIGSRINKLQWWQLGLTNNAVLQFEFWNVNRVVITNGEVNLRI